MRTELLEHITEEDIQSANQDFVRSTSVGPESYARVVAFAIGQPDDLDINEVVFRPTAQEL